MSWAFPSHIDESFKLTDENSKKDGDDGESDHSVIIFWNSKIVL